MFFIGLVAALLISFGWVAYAWRHVVRSSTMPSPSLSAGAQLPPPENVNSHWLETIVLPAASTAGSTYSVGAVPSKHRTVWSARRKTRVNVLTSPGTVGPPGWRYGGSAGEAAQRSVPWFEGSAQSLTGTCAPATRVSTMKMAIASMSV